MAVEKSRDPGGGRSVLLSPASPTSPASPAALTCIHAPIHCAATPNATEVEGISELDDLAVESFLEALGEVALAIARRESGGG